LIERLLILVSSHGGGFRVYEGFVVLDRSAVVREMLMNSYGARNTLRTKQSIVGVFTTRGLAGKSGFEENKNSHICAT
jgi:hypothetical protein